MNTRSYKLRGGGEEEECRSHARAGGGKRMGDVKIFYANYLKSEQTYIMVSHESSDAFWWFLCL